MAIIINMLKVDISKRVKKLGGFYIIIKVYLSCRCIMLQENVAVSNEKRLDSLQKHTFSSHIRKLQLQDSKMSSTIKCDNLLQGGIGHMSYFLLDRAPEEGVAYIGAAKKKQLKLLRVLKSQGWPSMTFQNLRDSRLKESAFTLEFFSTVLY